MVELVVVVVVAAMIKCACGSYGRGALGAATILKMCYVK